MKKWNVMTKEEKEFIVNSSEQINTAGQVEVLAGLSKDMYCPEVKGNCLTHGCAFFAIDRPYFDQRHIAATCTFAGKRELAFLYGYPTDWEETE